jgi:hypothetical protein
MDFSLPDVAVDGIIFISSSESSTEWKLFLDFNMRCLSNSFPVLRLFKTGLLLTVFEPVSLQ